MTPALTPSQSQTLAPYGELLRQWNPRINLVGPRTLQDLEKRHFADCAQLLSDLPRHPGRILDVGSGAGLPGLVLALLAPKHHYTLVESDTRKAAFLLTVCQSLKLTHVRVLAQRVEALTATPSFDVITARAFAPLPKLLAMSHPLLAPHGYWLLPKGEAVDEEIRACETQFPMTIERRASTVISSESKPGWVLKVTPQSA